MVLTITVWIYMYFRRIPFILTELMPAEKAKVDADWAALDRLSPPLVKLPSDNLKNLFEVPTIFYAMVLYLFVTNQVDSAYLKAAWIFAAFRWFHSAVHVTINLVPLRFGLYAISTMSLWFMILRAALSHFFG